MKHGPHPIIRMHFGQMARMSPLLPQVLQSVGFWLLR